MNKEDTAAPKKKTTKKKRKNQSAGIQILLGTSKWLMIIAGLIIALIVGLVVGFSVLGDGNASDVFDLRMWKHIFDLAFSN